MPEGKVKLKEEIQDNQLESTSFDQIKSDLIRLRDRPPVRRGPFVISDEDLFDELDLDKCGRIS